MFQTANPKIDFEEIDFQPAEPETVNFEPLPKKRNLFKTTASFLGDTTGLKGIGSALKDSLDTSKPLKPILKKAAGGAAKLGLTLGTLGTGSPGTIGSQVAQNAAVGAGFGAAESLEKNKSLRESALQTGTGAALGGAIPLGFGVVKKGLGLLPSLSRNLEKVSLRLTPTQRRDLGTKIDDITEFLSSNRISGSPQARYDKVNKLYMDEEVALDNFLRKDLKTRTIAKEYVVRQLRNVKRRFANERDVLTINKQIDGLIDTVQARYPSNIPAWKINQLKRSTYENAFNRAGDKVLDDVEFAMGDKLKGVVELIADGPTGRKLIRGKSLSQFNKDYGTIINARKLLKIAESRDQLGGMGKFISTILGGVFGGVAGGGIGAGVGALAGQQVGKIVAGTATRSAIGSAARRFSQIPIEKAKEPVRRFLTPTITR